MLEVQSEAGKADLRELLFLEEDTSSFQNLNKYRDKQHIWDDSEEPKPAMEDSAAASFAKPKKNVSKYLISSKFLKITFLVNQKGLPKTSYAWGKKAGMEDELLKKTLPGAKWKKLRMTTKAASLFKSTTSLARDSPNASSAKMSSFAN